MKEEGFTEDIEENGTTFYENAYIKANALKNEAWFAIADDSGLEVDALDGRPGVYSARYAGEPCNDANNNARLLSELSGVPAEGRTGRYVSVIACIDPSGNEFFVRGTCEGILLEEPRGNGGFGYDPLFYVPELGKTFAEVTPEEKDAVSHRGKAIRAFLKQFSDKIVEVPDADK